MKTATSPASASLVATDSRRRIRSLKDRFAEYAVSIGGVAVIIAVVLIFFYLFLVVLPLFRGAEIEAHHSYPLPGDRNAETTYLAMEEQAEIAVRFTDSSRIYFFRVADGEILAEENLPDSGNNRVSAFSVIDDATGGVVYGFDDGKVLLAQHVYEVSYPDNVRTITPKLEYPLGEELIQADPEGREIISLTAQMDDDAVVFAVLVSTGEIVVTRVELERSFLTDELSLADSSSVVISDLLSANESPRYLLIDPTQNWFYVGGESGEVLAFDIRDQDAIVLNERLQLTPRGERLTVLKFLMGGISLLAGTNTGEVHQWFPVRDDNNKYSVQLVRSFAGSNAPVTDIAIEQRRKGFITAQSNGFAGIHYATSERTLLNERLTEHEIRKISVSPRGNALITLDEHGTAQFWTIDNEFPEISWSALWGKVWYESYAEPEFIWQSSSATTDFEPKFSLVPLSFGTLKAAFYAMLVAVPLAIMGAIFTAYFMPSELRRMIKPTVEVMEALPTVILGFLAGLWMAPFIESNLPGVFMILVLSPIAVLIFGFAWTRFPKSIRFMVPDGWEPALLMPVIAVTGWIAFSLSVPVEAAFFGGNMPQWISTELGISFDQRNSIVVGAAMGFAVIPTIFSIAEDAIFGVPKHLSYGSLALGATPWQTLVRVVMPTASPGIFSALMIGMGRAVGETMIVLMATGNTPIMDFNIFQGMRTLSANIAVEMPESEVGSTHYRVLFLAALVLFLFTFVFNTVAEIVRQRLRAKYSNI